MEPCNTLKSSVLNIPPESTSRSNDGSLLRKRMFSGISNATRCIQIEEERRDILKIPVDDVMEELGEKSLFSVSHAGWDDSLLMAEEHLNVPKHQWPWHLASRSVHAGRCIQRALHPGKLKTDVVFCPWLEPLVENLTYSGREKVSGTKRTSMCACSAMRKREGS